MHNPDISPTLSPSRPVRPGRFRWLLTVPLLALSAVAQAQGADAGVLPPAVALSDAGPADAGWAPDAGSTPDAGSPPDAASVPDAAPTAEAVPPPPAEPPPAEEPPPPAEEAEAEFVQAEPEDSGEMVVTARRRKESIQTVPVAVTGLNEVQLQSSAIRDVSDLNGAAPGFTTNQGGSQVTPGALSTAIRGIGIVEVEKSYELPVGTMIDGIILGNAVGSNVANFDLESVEILRGAQGTLFGRNVTAGLISLRTIRPDTEEYTGKAAFTYGAFNRMDYKLSVNVPVVKNVLAARAAVMWLNEDGYMNRIRNNVDSGKNSPKLNHLYIVGSLLYTPTKSLDVYLKYEHQRYRGQGLPSIVGSTSLPSLCPANPGNPNYCRPQDASGKDIDFNDLTNRQKLSDRATSNQDQTYDLDAITGELTYRINPKYSVVSLTGWRAFKDDAWTDIDATPDPQINNHRHGPYKQITQEFRLHANPIEDLNLVAGLYGWYSHYRAISEAHNLLDIPFVDNSRPPIAVDNPATPWNELEFGLNPPGSFSVADTQQTSYSAAAFAQGDWEFLPNTTLTLGGRITHDVKRLKAVFYNDRPGVYMDQPYPPYVVTFPTDTPGVFMPTDDPDDYALVKRNSWTRFTGKASLSYLFDEDLIGENNSLLLYAGYANGFRSGGFNGRPASAAVAKPYDPETVDQFELGIKSSWGRGRFVANVAGYYTLYHDKQESYQIPDMTTSQGNASAYDNAGQASIKGLELELSTMPLKGKVGIIDRFRIWGVGALTDAQYDDFKVALSGMDIQNYAKGPYKIEMRLAPRVQVAAGLDLPFELPDNVGGRIVPNASYRYRTEQRVELTVDPITHRPSGLGMSDPAGYLDASLTAEFDKFLGMQWRVTGYVKNITDYVELLGAQNIGVATRAVFGRPRTWGLEIQARYN